MVDQPPRIRCLRPEDGLIDALVDVWGRSAPRDPITVDRFRDLVLLDANFQPGGLHLAYLGERLVGAAYAVVRRVAMTGADLEPARGWIPFFFVDPAARRQGVGRELLTSAMDWLRKAGRTEADFASYTPSYVLPGLDAEAYPEAAALLADLGFRRLYQAAAMDRRLAGYEAPDAVRHRLAGLEARGFRFGPPTVDELVPLVALAAERFSADWARAIRDAIRSGLPLDHIVAARDPAGEVVGWAMWGAYEHRLERFGPFGVRDDQRGLGLGEVLLHLSLQRMRARGAYSAWFLWTGEESPAGRLYRKAGFTVTRRFDILRAQL
ncbi:GNAT family N-acetyltransferase [Flindersiella endophytica]